MLGKKPRTARKLKMGGERCCSWVEMLAMDVKTRQLKISLTGLDDLLERKKKKKECKELEVTPRFRA